MSQYSQSTPKKKRKKTEKASSQSTGACANPEEGEDSQVGLNSHETCRNLTHFTGLFGSDCNVLVLK